MVTIRVTVENWEKHNGSKKKNHRYFLFENRFFEDDKISRLKQIDVLLYIKCLCIAADLSSSSFTIHAGLMPRRWRVNDKLLLNSCKTLQQFQLLTYEICESFNNTIQKKTIQNKAKQVPEGSKTVESKNLDRAENVKIWSAYFDAYRLRYGIEPVRNLTVNSQISNLRKKLGTEDAVKVVEFYLKHNDSWYVKQTHTFGLCLKDAETLRTQMLKGKAITGTDVKRFEKTQSTMDMIDNAKKGGF